MSKHENEEMSQAEMTEAIRRHGGDPSMTLGDSLGALVSISKVRVATKPSKTVKAVTSTMTPKFSFQKPVVLPAIQKFLSKEEQEQKLEEERQRYAKRAKALEEFAAQVGPWMPDLVISIRAYREMSEEARELADNKQKNEANMKMLADSLNQEDPGAQNIAVKAFAASYVSTSAKNKHDVQDVVSRLANYDFIKETTRQGKGVLRVYDANYELAGKFQDDPQALEIFRDLWNLVRETKKIGREFFQTLEKAFEAKNTDPMTVDNLSDLIYERPAEKKEGTIVLDIPEEEGRDREGKIFTHKSGRMLFGVLDNKVFVIDGIGGKEKVARDLADKGTFLFLNQLRENRVRFTDNMGDTARKSVTLLHKLVCMGIQAMREKAEAEAARKAEEEAKAVRETEYVVEREALLARAASEGIPIISAEEFLLQGKPGAVLLNHLPDPWVRKDKQEGGTPVETKYRHPENTVVIRQDDGKIRVICPNRLASLYQGAQEATFPGEKFSGLEYPLGLMLRIMWGVTKGQKDEADRKAKSEAIETGGEAQ